LQSLEVFVEFLRVILRERCEQDYIERLETVGGMRGKDG
jgi:hypothetical protein